MNLMDLPPLNPPAPILELPVEVLLIRMAEMERGWVRVDGVDLRGLSENPRYYREYIQLCRALRLKTRKKAA